MAAISIVAVVTCLLAWAVIIHLLVRLEDTDTYLKYVHTSLDGLDEIVQKKNAQIAGLENLVGGLHLFMAANGLECEIVEVDGAYLVNSNALTVSSVPSDQN